MNENPERFHGVSTNLALVAVGSVTVSLVTLTVPIISLIVGLIMVVTGIQTGLRDRWPLWSCWWLAWGLFLIVACVPYAFSTLIISIYGRLAVVHTWWIALLLTLLIFLDLALFRKQDGKTIAFGLLPWSLEWVRFSLLGDLQPGYVDRHLIMLAVALLIYLGIIYATLRRSSGAVRWRPLVVGAIIFLLGAFTLSFPIGLFFAVYPLLLPPLLALAFGVLVGGRWLDALTGQNPLRGWRQSLMAAWAVLLVLALIVPWQYADALPLASAGALVERESGTRTSIIIDTDLSQDDFVAVMYLLLQPDVEIRAITISQGVARIEPGLENLRRWLALAERVDIPIGVGPTQPMMGENAFPILWSAPNELLLRPIMPKPDEALFELLPAAELIRAVSQDTSRPITVVALGTMTNLGLALREEPSIAQQIERIVISGGAINVPGNINSDDPSNPNRVAEWNLYVDPLADEIALQSGVPIELYPLDVTAWDGDSPVLVSKQLVQKFLGGAAGREMHLMGRIMNAWLLTGIPRQADAVPMWDVVVAVGITDPELCTDWQQLPIRIVQGPQEVAGQTVVDAVGGSMVHVCMGGDQAIFDGAFGRLISG